MECITRTSSPATCLETRLALPARRLATILPAGEPVCGIRSRFPRGRDDYTATIPAGFSVLRFGDGPRSSSGKFAQSRRVCEREEEVFQRAGAAGFLYQGETDQRQYCDPG